MFSGDLTGHCFPAQSFYVNAKKFEIHTDYSMEIFDCVGVMMLWLVMGEGNRRVDILEGEASLLALQS